MTREVRKSNCHYCGYLCGFDVTVEDGRMVDIQPDPTRYPYDPSVIARCRRWRMNLAEIDGPGRINHPLRRVGKRGSGSFEEVSWDDALDDIAERLSSLREQYGGRTLASAIGGPHATYWPLHRFLSLYGSPNNFGIGQICWNPRIWMDTITFGWPLEPDLSPLHTKAVLLWATNPAESDNSLFWATLVQMQKDGVPLMVVDARQSRTARAADQHLMPLPGTDCHLALALIREIIEADLYDHDFVDAWCEGFEGLRAHVQPYTLEHTQQVTGVPAESIRQVAHTYARAEAAVLLSGRGIDQLGPNTPPVVRALCILRAITGNVDKPGANFVQGMSDFTPEVDSESSVLLSQEGRLSQLNAGITPLQSYDGYDVMRTYTAKAGKRLPIRYLTSAHPGIGFRAMATGDPYPIKALIVMAANPVTTYANTNLVLQAFEQLDLLVVLEYYLTPTAQLADYVLPIAGAFERPVFQIHGGVANFAYGGDAAVAPYYDRKTDYEVLRELGLRLGQGPHWPAATLRDEYERAMEGTGVSFGQFAQTGIYAPREGFYHHALPDEDGNPQGFATPSGKVQLAAPHYEQLGGQCYPEPADESIVQANVQAGQVVLVTGARVQPYWASSYYQNPEFRKLHPFPLVTMGQQTCDDLGLADGDWVDISNERGSARLKVKVGVVPYGVASAEYGWWYPEEEPGLPHLSGALRSNINMLTTADIEGCEPSIGTWTYNGIVARVQKAADQRDLGVLE